MKYDYIIVGQGMAGSLLAWFLYREKKSFIIIDAYNPSSASNVGGGIIHPVTGRRIVKTWMADELVPFAKHTYHELENFFGEKFFHDIPVLELLSTVKELNDWQSRSETEEMGGYVNSENRNELYNEVLAPFIGKIQINNSGWTDMQRLVTVLREFFAKQNALLEESFDFAELMLLNNVVQYKNIEAARIIFCEGYKAQQNPFWKHLVFLPAKGEILTIESADLKLNHILIKSIFILPIGNNRFKVGSNYEWSDLTEAPTESVKEKILSQLNDIIKVDYKVVEHKAAIRPSVKDRRPYLGMHPEYSQVGILNGLGAKGALLAPYFSNHLTQHLVYAKPLMPEVDVTGLERM